MHVIATAGHVDHGKSTLVRALTGMEPDRWAEERRRGMTIDLGYAWTALPSGREIAFVDVPGHERFTTNMLAGVGPVPAVLLVVAADDGWSAQTAEHVAALDAFGVRHGLLAVTRSDLADPAAVIEDVRARLAPTTLGAIPSVAVSGRTGAGLPELRAALDALVDALPEPDPGARVRLWVDRSFVVKGFGTVLTGTLGAGLLSVGDTLELDGEQVTVRGLQRLGVDAAAVPAVARVAVNLRAVPRGRVHRGQALLTPGAWHRTSAIDVRVTGAATDRLARQLVLHIGSAAVAVTVRPLGAGHLRLTLGRSLPLQIGDRALLRDPGLRRVVAGALVLDPAPPSLRARGAASARSAELVAADPTGGVVAEVGRRQVVRRDLLVRLGIGVGQLDPAAGVERAGWLVAAGRWARWREQLPELVDRARAADGLRAGIAQADAVLRLALPDPALLPLLVAEVPGLELSDGQLRRAGQQRVLDPGLVAALAPVMARLEADPFGAPTADELAAAGLGARQLAAAAAAGVLLRLAGDVVVAADAAAQAELRLATLPAPFTLSAARQVLGTTRRVAVPLLEHLDRTGRTRRIDETGRVLTGRVLAGRGQRRD